MAYLKSKNEIRCKTKHHGSFFLVIVCLFLLSLVFQVQAQGKKGCAGQTANAYKVGAFWAYDWSTNTTVFPGNVEHVPMWWSYYGASQDLDTAGAVKMKAAGANYLLAYNEPDKADQANLTVAYALQGFKQAGIACAAAGLQLISPACADDNSTWMQQFMAAVASQGLKCDAVAVHSYLRDPNSFLSYIDGIHNRYGKNIWITEFAPTDWASPTAVTTAEVENFIKIVIPALESRSYVIRYSWYCGTLPGPNVLGTAALIDANGNLTAAGIAYKNAGTSSSATPVPTTPPVCTATAIVPYLQVNGGTWQNVSAVTVSSGAAVSIGPQPLTGGTWSWSGCNVSGATREITIYPTGSCTLTATYTNDCGARSTQSFSITVSGTTLSKGDVNGSGTVDIVDALMVAQYYVGLNPSNFNAAAADVNCSGTIDIVDALVIAQYYVGLLAALNC